jgi:hypothetical protein
MDLSYLPSDQSSPDDIQGYIAQAAKARGIDPKIALKVAKSEGLNQYVGDNGSSFGPFQLHYGGMASGGNAVSGLGDEFTAATGKHASDPTTVRDQIDFALDHASKNGWGAFHGAAKVGVEPMAGIKKQVIPDYLGSSWETKPSTTGTKAAPPSAPATVPDYLGASWDSEPSAAQQPTIAKQQAETLAPTTGAIDVLANEEGESPASAIAKGIATTAIKGASHIPGMMGDVAGLSDYLMARARSAYTGEPIEQVMAHHNALWQNIANSGGNLAPLASDYLRARAATPSGQDIANKIFGITGEYKPTTDTWRNLMGAGEIATTAGLAGVPVLPATAAGTAGNIVSEQTGEPLFGLGAALAVPGTAWAARNALSNLAGSVRPNIANLADIAQNRFGIPIQPGQLSESPSLRMAHSFLNRLPMSGAGESIAEQRASWQRALSHTIGEDSPVLDEDTMAHAQRRNGQTIENVGNRTTIHADPQLQNGLIDTLIGARNAGLADHEIRPLESIFNQVVDNIDNNGEIAGSKYVNMTKYKTQLWNAQHSPNPNIREWAGNLREVLDDALERHASPEDRADLSQARYQYRNMKILEDVVDPVGDVSPGRLWSKVNQKMSNAPKYGRGGDLADLARISNRFVQEQPTSRTGENLTIMGALTSPLRYGAGFIGGRMLGNALLRNPAISGDIINRSLGRPVAGNALLQNLYRGAGPYALQSNPSNALAAP